MTTAVSPSPTFARRLRRGLAGGAMATAAVLGFAGVASAHHADVTAAATCATDTAKINTGQATVSYTATAWQTTETEKRVNTNLSVDRRIGSGPWVNVGSGAFTAANSYSFSGSFQVPSDGSSVTVRVTAVANYGPKGEFDFGGTYNDVVLNAATCTVGPTTTTAAPTTTTPAPTTTAPTTTAVVTEVLAESATVQLAYTGDHTGTIALIGAGLLASGGLIVIRTRRKLEA
jgi:LPXTG-motif cell wall-anchored protein